MIYAVGDIHGRFDLLDALLDWLPELKLKASDTILFLGDYVDRGPDSAQVVERLVRLRAEHEHTVFLRGNHEDLMIRAADAAPPRLDAATGNLLLTTELMLWLQNGGMETLLSYEREQTLEGFLDWTAMVPEDHWAFLRSTTLELRSGHYCFVHAGVLPDGVEWVESDRDPRLWIREPFLLSTQKWEQTVVFGHTPQQDGLPLVEVNKIGIDTAAVFGGALTAVAVDDRFPHPTPGMLRFYQVLSDGRRNIIR